MMLTRQKTFAPNKWSYCQRCTCVDKRKKVISKCPECEDYMCISCKLEHSKEMRTRSHKTFAVSERDIQDIEDKASCSSHKSQDVDTYCITCDTLVCPVCVDKGHKSHHVTHMKVAANDKIHRMYETCIPKVRAKFEFLQKEKRTYEDISGKVIRSIEARSRVIKGSLSEIADRLKKELNTRDSQNLKVYDNKIEKAYDELTKTESLLAACSLDSEWNNIVIMKKGNPKNDNDLKSDDENIPQYAAMTEDDIDTQIIKGLLSTFGKSKLSKDDSSRKDRHIEDDRKELQLEIARLKDENQYLKQALKRATRTDGTF